MAIGLSSVTLSMVLIAGLLGLIPDRDRAVMEGRGRLCESAAVSFTLLAEENQFDRVRLGLEAIVNRNPELLTAAVRRTDGEIVARVGDHEALWNDPKLKNLIGAQMEVPIMHNDEPWGTLEFSFEPLSRAGWLGIWESSAVRLPFFLAITCGLGTWFYLRRVLKYLDPTRVVPGRVRQALDTLAEGLLLLDKDERIVLANKSFMETAGVQESQLVGKRASTLPWMSTDFSVKSDELPWQRVLRGENVRPGEMLRLQTSSEEARTFMVNSTMILDDQGNSQGALTSFGDVTPLERKKLELAEMLNCLQKSSEEIRRQNSELERLALEDPLTGCLNRRSFFENFETLWDEALSQGRPLSCVMTDIDFFKSINDNFGHSFGDEVLRAVAHTLKQAAREGDIVCRYGGEEFCVLMRDADPEAAARGAERFRQAVASIKLPKITVTASFGLSSTSMGAQNNQELLDQADKALYAAKRNGRNCVVRFDEVPADLVVDEASVSRSRRTSDPAIEKPIPFHAVIALISALAYRDLPTAEHSRRVADLCVLVAEGLMSPSQCYLLEIAALLHDIGKIGVPDSILLKAGRLSAEEAEVMRTYQRIGIELVRASFKSPELCAILENRMTPPDAGSDPSKPGARTRVSVGARILAIADSYDAMTRDSVYRRGMEPDAAFAELRRCAGVQFDAELVERFISCVKSRRSNDVESGRVSKETALAVGIHIEHLATALDRRDLSTLKDLAGHLQSLANRQGADKIAEQAGELQEALDSEEHDLLSVLQEADSLLKLCRESQRAYFDDIRPVATVSQPV
jgi:diguanylate cyclase (GGDEF)-like protein/PAS domain S-box-containing protein